MAEVLLSLEYLGSQVWLYGRTIDNVKAPAGAGDMFHYAMVLTEDRTDGWLLRDPFGSRERKTRVKPDRSLKCEIRSVRATNRTHG